MFGTRVTAATEEIKHFHRCPAENQLSAAQNGNFIKELIERQTVLVSVLFHPYGKEVSSSQSFDCLSHTSVLLLRPSEPLKMHPSSFQPGLPLWVLLPPSLHPASCLG